MKRYEIIDHGYVSSDYFPGCGVCFTEYDDIATGIGNNAKEAYNDAIDKLYSSGNHSSDYLDKILPKRPRGINAKNKVPSCSDDDGNFDVYYYVSVRIKSENSNKVKPQKTLIDTAMQSGR